MRDHEHEWGLESGLWPEETIKINKQPWYGASLNLRCVDCRQIQRFRVFFKRRWGGSDLWPSIQRCRKMLKEGVVVLGPSLEFYIEKIPRRLVAAEAGAGA